MRRYQRRGNSRLFSRGLIVILFFVSLSIILCDCRKGEGEQSQILKRFFNLLNEGSYKKAASLCVGDIDPYLLDFTNIVSLRFMDRVIVKETEITSEKASFHVFIFLKDGKELAYFSRNEQGELVVGTMTLVKETSDSKIEWKVKCDEFWAGYHWHDITRKIRLNIIALTEEVIKYRGKEKSLPVSLEQLGGTELDSIKNPVTGEVPAFIAQEEGKPGTVSFYYDKDEDEVRIKGYDAIGEEIDYYIVSSSVKADKAHLLEFFDVPPRTITTVVPAYPEEERKEGIEGTVSLRLLIGRDGLVQDVEIAKSLSIVFDSLAVTAVKRSVFSPAKREGKPVAVWYYFPVRFVLEK